MSPAKRLTGYLALVCAGVVTCPQFTNAGSAPSATVTGLVGHVQLISPEHTVRPAVINDSVTPETTIQTENESRLELTFGDHSIARFGGNTTAKLDEHGHNVDLQEGIGLFQILSGSSYKVDADRVGVSLSGVTGVFEYHPNIYKFVVLHGTGRLYRRHRVADSMLVEAGQMVFGKPTAGLSEPVDFEIQPFIATSRLITDFRPLDGKRLAEASRRQDFQKSKKVLLDTNLVIHGGGSLVSVQQRPKNEESAAPAPAELQQSAAQSKN